MEPSDFHMFLSSNTNPVEFPNNKATDFTTLYGGSVKLDGNWEVGVKQVTYPNTILTTMGTESLSTTKNGATILEGKKAVISAEKEYYDFDTYTVEKPTYDKDKGYSPEDVVKNFNDIALAKRGIVKLNYLKKYDKMTLDIFMDDVVIGFSYDFGYRILRFTQLAYFGYTPDTMARWGAQAFNGKVHTNDKWTVWVFPLYRISKQVFTICEKDVDMSTGDMIKRIQSLSKDYGVEWKQMTKKQYSGLKKRMIKSLHLSLHKKNRS